MFYNTYILFSELSFFSLDLEFKTDQASQLPTPVKIQMIFCHKPYYNPNLQTLTKKSLSDICPKPKKLYKLYNAK
jgi:hypothetical protein